MVDKHPSQISGEIHNVSKTDEENILNESKDTDDRENDGSFEKIKDSILKKHNFDLSPQFVYSKKPITTMVNFDTKNILIFTYTYPFLAALYLYVYYVVHIRLVPTTRKFALTHIIPA